VSHREVQSKLLPEAGKMSEYDHDLPEDKRRKYETPYTGKKTIPTISKYRAEQEARQEKAKAFEGQHLNEEDQQKYEQDVEPHADDRLKEESGRGANETGNGAESEAPQDTSEVTPATDPKQRAKKSKKKGDDGAERQVTDPVTHLPVTISDYTNEALEQVQENQQNYGSTARTATGSSNKGKSSKDLEDELQHLRKERAAMQALFPPPNFDTVKEELSSVHKLGVTVGLVGTVLTITLVLGVERLLDAKILRESGWLLAATRWLVLLAVAGGLITALVLGVRDWMGKRIDSVWDEELWEANRNEGFKKQNNRNTESVIWLNSLLSAVWPLVNPDLFTSIADMLEDGQYITFELRRYSIIRPR